MTIVTRGFAPDDVAAAHALQCRAYPEALHDSPAAFASRIAFADGLSLVALEDDALRGYILAHPWTPGAPPPVDAVLAAPKGPGLAHYIHDLSIAPEARGTGLSQRLVAESTARADALGLTRCELIAVRGAAVFWARLGFVPGEMDAALAAKVAAYGDDAVFMMR